MLTYRGVFRVIVALCLAAAIYVGFTKMVIAQEGPVYNIVFLIDSSNSMTGGGGANVNHDLEDKRIRFARFLVRYMQTFYPEQSRAGLIRFYGKAGPEDELVPLTWVNNWALADLKKVGDADLQGLAYTNFKAGLTVAEQYFVDEAGNPLPCSDDPEGEKCYVLLFSDGEFDNQTRNQQEVANLLEGLRQNRQIQVVPILFGNNQDAMWWQENTGVMVNGDDDRQAVYAEIFRHIELGAPLERFSEPDLFDGSITLPVITTSRFHQAVSITLIADDLISDTWDPAPTLNSGAVHWWFDPGESEIQGTLNEPSEAQTGGTLVYYTLGESFYPLNVTAMVVPERAHVNQPIELSAQLSVGGQAFTATSGFAVQAHLEPDDEVISLYPQTDGRFTGSITCTTPGTYTVTFVPMRPAAWEHLVLNEAQQQIYVDDKLYLTSMEAVLFPERAIVNQPIEIYGWFTVDGRKLEQPKGLGIQAIMSQTAIALTPYSNGLFKSVVTMTDPGEYKVIFSPTTVTSQSLLLVSDLQQTFSVDTFPNLQLSIKSSKVIARNNVSLAVTLYVENYSEVTSNITPSLILLENTAQLTLTALGSGEFLAVAEIPFDRQTTLQATLPGGTMLHGASFNEQVVQHIVSPINTSAPNLLFRLRDYWPWWLMLFGIVVISPVVVIWHRWQFRNRQEIRQQREIRRDLLALLDKSWNPEAGVYLKEQLGNLDMTKPHLEEMTEFVRKYGQAVSEAYRYDKLGGN